MTDPTNRTEFNRQLARWGRKLPAAGQAESWTEHHGTEFTHEWTLAVSDDGTEAFMTVASEGLAVGYHRADVL